jgi:hypothetical protein
MLKRSMFGRAKIDLLSRRFLLAASPLRLAPLPRATGGASIDAGAYGMLYGHRPGV